MATTHYVTADGILDNGSAIFASQRQSMGFSIWRPLLDRPPGVLAKEISHYIHTRAPEGSWHKAITEDEAEQLGEE